MQGTEVSGTATPAQSLASAIELSTQDSTNEQARRKTMSSLLIPSGDRSDDGAPVHAHTEMTDDQIDLATIERLLRRPESVEDAAVVLRDGADGEIVGFVTLVRNAIESQIGYQRQLDDEYETQQIQLWETIFDRGAYTQDIQPEAVGRDFNGWVSAYDGAPLDRSQMIEWLDETIETLVSRVSSHSLNVLELGTGSGMILFSIANSLQSYLGLEPSRKAVDFVNATASSIPGLAAKVQVHQGTATDLQLLGVVSPSVVVINSVAQYFPSRDYLLAVVEGLLYLGSVHTIFFGDIRSFALQNEFLIGRALHKLGEKATKGDIREEMMEMAQAELELLTDPGFFSSLAEQFPNLIEHVEILPKKMRATNELSCYRYTAIIHVRDRNQKHLADVQQRMIHEVKSEEWIDFVDLGLDRQSLLQRLETSGRNIMAVSNICHGKTIFERHTIDLLNDGPDENVLHWISTARQKSQSCPSLSALDLVGIAEEAGYKVEISWARQYSQRGGLDAVFHRHQPSSGGKTLFRFPTDHQGRAPSTFTSQPLQQQAEQAIQQQLYETLEAQLPLHMVPEEIIVLPKLPVNAKGQVDRDALAKRA
ncbi:MAG: hypothetical protein Q9169_001657 [Polycauliona sp. 2 TL-2023]